MDPSVWMDQGMGLLLGLALAATCGLRAFLPLLMISLLAFTGKVELGEAFAWMGSPIALTCFATAVLAEVVGDKVPVVDHALDGVGTVVKPAAATVAMASMITEFHPLVAVVLGLVAGGTVAEGVHVVKAKTRLASTALTGTIANPVLSVLEDVAALLAVILAWVVPVLVAGLALGVLAWFGTRRWRGAEQEPA